MYIRILLVGWWCHLLLITKCMHIHHIERTSMWYVYSSNKVKYLSVWYRIYWTRRKVQQTVTNDSDNLINALICTSAKIQYNLIYFLRVLVIFKHLEQSHMSAEFETSNSRSIHLDKYCNSLRMPSLINTPLTYSDTA